MRGLSLFGLFRRVRDDLWFLHEDVRFIQERCMDIGADVGPMSIQMLIVQHDLGVIKKHLGIVDGVYDDVLDTPVSTDDGSA